MNVKIFKWILFSIFIISLVKCKSEIKRHLINHQIQSPIKVYFNRNQSICSSLITLSVGNKTISVAITPSQDSFINQRVKDNCTILPTSVTGTLINDSQSYVSGIVTTQAEFYGKVVIGSGKFTKIYYVDSWLDDHNNRRALIYSYADLIQYHYRSGTAKYGILTESIVNLDKYYTTDQDLSFLEEDNDEAFTNSHVLPYASKNISPALESESFPPKKKICKVLAISDASFTVSYNSDKQTIQAAIWNVVLTANKIIQSTASLNNHDGMEFKLDNILIEEQDWYINDENKEGIVDPMEYLLQRSRQNYNNYCLVIVFTNHQFINHENSISWISPSKQFGLCSQYQQHPVINHMISANVLVISRKSFNSGTLPQAMIENEFIQELANVIGIPESDNDCWRNGKINVILSQDNQCDRQSILSSLSNQLSKCSDKQIVNENVTLNQCGDGKIQIGEECDCGTQHQCLDTCCDAKTCKLTKFSQCSPSQGPCCNPATCKFYNRSQQIICLHDEECYYSSICDEDLHGAKCPPPPSKPDTTLCEGNSKTCQNGECSGSLCSLYGHKSCDCQAQQKLCHICCWNEYTKTCHSILDYPEYRNLSQLYKPEGSDCGSSTGICSWDGRCVPAVRIGAGFISVILGKLMRYLGKLILVTMIAVLSSFVLIYFLVYNEPFFLVMIFVASVYFAYLLNKKCFSYSSPEDDDADNNTPVSRSASRTSLPRSNFQHMSS